MHTAIQVSLQSKCPITGTQSFGNSGVIPSYLLIDGGELGAEMIGRKRLLSFFPKWKKGGGC